MEVIEMKTTANDSDDKPGEATPAERQMLLAMRALDHQIQVTKAKLTQARKGWADRLKDATQSMNEIIRDHIPSSGCKERLVEIQEYDKKRQRIESDKSSELEGFKQEIAEAESAFYEILRRKANPNQQNLNFGTSAPANFDPAGGILLSASHLSSVRSAVESFGEATDGDVDGMDDLTARLDELGVADIGFPDEMQDDDEDDDDDG